MVRKAKRNNWSLVMLMISWIVTGLLAGLFTGSLMKRWGYGTGWGLWLDGWTGVGGATLGGFFMHSNAFIDQGGLVYTVIVALVSAITLTVISGLIGAKRYL
jgi:uncharacterized membrane protein YeaQ/YmgE (transglycosylase-associated protein family)